MATGYSLLRSLTAALMLGVLAGPALARDMTFNIIRVDGSTATVTSNDMQTIGSVELRTPLVATPGGEHTAKGPLMRDVLAHFKAVGQSVDITALDGARIEIPSDDFTRYDVIVATEIDGKIIGVRERGPAWLVYPLKDHPELVNPVYDMRSIWQIKEVRMK